MRDPIIDFAVRRVLSPVRLGMRRLELLARLGPPEGTTGQPAGEPVMWCHDDLQIGLSGHGVVDYIAVEPAGSRIAPPAPIQLGPIETPTKDTLLRGLASRGEAAVECTPFVPDETWWRVPTSGMLMFSCEDGRLNNIHLSSRHLGGGTRSASAPIGT
ncbi:MAG: hypothetical protein IRZ07_14285 [Microbispora sp.]|nr:hypothetical protein [Microbispora sp.]